MVAVDMPWMLKETGRIERIGWKFGRRTRRLRVSRPFSSIVLSKKWNPRSNISSNVVDRPFYDVARFRSRKSVAAFLATREISNELFRFRRYFFSWVSRWKYRGNNLRMYNVARAFHCYSWLYRLQLPCQTVEVMRDSNCWIWFSIFYFEQLNS